MTNNKNKPGTHLCPKCGQPTNLERIDRPYVSQQINHILNVDRGFLYTAKELLIRPGNAIKGFLLEDRRRLTKPIVYLIFTSVIFALIMYSFNIKYSYLNINRIQVLQDKVSMGMVGEWLNNNIGYTNLILGCFFAFWIRIFFRKHDINFYEIIVMLCFVLGEATLIFSLFILLGKLTSIDLISVGAVLLFFVYVIWAIGHFFGKRKLVNYIKSLIIFILGHISYLLVFIIIGYIFKAL